MFGGQANVREQINALTAYVDVGQLYGSDDSLARHLRDLTNDGGLLRVNDRFRDSSGNRELLPFSSVEGNMCATRKHITNDTTAEEVPCFVAGNYLHISFSLLSSLLYIVCYTLQLLSFSSWFYF